MRVNGRPQKGDLFPVTAAPLAKQEMNAQAKPLAKREAAIQRVRLQARRFLATWQQVAHPFRKCF